MVEYIIKSTICLTILYFLYYFLLRNIKSFQFNRFYLLFIIIFSLIVPLIQVSLGTHSIISQNALNYSSSISNTNIQEAIVEQQKTSVSNIADILLIIYLSVSMLLLIRFVINLQNIITLIKKSDKDLNSHSKIVLSQKKTLPYSFFQFIIVNKTEFEKGLIDSDLITHELAHCKQYHSFDIVFIEIVKIIFWFNPIIWILKKEIQLNHEYLADKKVLQTQNVKAYQDILLNLVFRNNSTYLASNFNYSLTKKRLIMMRKNCSSVKSMVRKITIVPLVIILTASLTVSQKRLPNENSKNFDKEWWYPIVEEHEINIHAFNNFNNVFEMGVTNSIENGIVTLTDALFIIKQDDGYNILKSPLAYHDLDKNIISCDEATVEVFKYKPDETVDAQSIISGKNLEYQLNKNSWIMNNPKGQIKRKE